MDTLETFEITSANVTRICNTLWNTAYKELANVFFEAVSQMDSDTEMLWDFTDFYRAQLSGEDDGYGEVALSCAQFRPNDSRRIARLINQNRCLADCHMLSMLAMEICLEVYYEIEERDLVFEEPSPSDLTRILALMCEASEAVALARISTAVIDLHYDAEDTKVELNQALDTAEKRHEPLRKWNEKDKEKRENTKSLATEICSEVWRNYPNARIGPVAQIVSEAFADDDNGLFRPPEIAGPAIYGRVKPDALKKHLQSQFPDKVTAGGRPSKAEQINAPKVSDLIYELLEEHLESTRSDVSDLQKTQAG